MDKLDPKTDGASADITAENIAALKALFPECVTEGKVDFEVLRELLGSEVEDRPERYSFNWNGKSRARRIAQTPSTGTLRPCREESVNWDTTQNIFIEGDNLEVLKLLQKSYHKRVKMIYIDPPYNTGNEFIYPDRYQDNLETYLRYTGQLDTEGLKVSANSETSGRYHTNWLNMMLPRLKLARNLLRDDGVIFVSIDDHEVQNLRSLLDEVFGPENFIATVIWQKVYAPKSSARHFSEDHDYILVYARSAEQWRPELLPRTDEQDAHYSNPDNDPRGVWRADGMSARNYYSKGTYKITTPSGRRIDGPPSGRYWVYAEDKFRELDRDKRIWWGEDGTNQPAVKRFLTEVKAGRVPQTLWKYEDVGHTQEAKKDLLKLVSFASSDSVFDTPKPPRLIKQMLRIGTQSSADDLILDFFAGSGSTGDAVMQINAEDGGNRRFILVQLPEPTDATDFPTVAEITKARLRAASKNASSAAVKPDDKDETQRRDCGIRVYKLDASNMRAWDADFESLEPALFDAVENIKHDRTELDILYELLLKYGLDLAVPVKQREIAGKTVYVVGAGALIVCLGDGITLEVADGIAALKAELQPEIMRVVFKDAGFPNDVVKTNTVQILRQAGIDDVKSL